jgi:hypothetical protein
MGTDAAIDIATRISGATADIATRVTGAIRDAARVTGAGFEYLLNTALRESNLNPSAKAKSSSATGLFQFIDQTWLGTMKQSGKALGYGKYADAITRTPQGKFVVDDPAMRREIMALRKDPTANAVMAGAFANSNAKVLNDRLGRKPTDGELYMAHFLGASGAARFIKAAEARPDAKAANYLSARRAGECVDLLRQAGRRAQPQAGLRRAGRAARRDRRDAFCRRESGSESRDCNAVPPPAPARQRRVPQCNVAPHPSPRHSGRPATRGGRAVSATAAGDRDICRDRIRADTTSGAAGAPRPGVVGRRSRCSSRLSAASAVRSDRCARALGRRAISGGRDADGVAPGRTALLGRPT